MIRVYNTLTREKEEFKPLEPGKIKMYVCGPTVYNYIHIGNARSSVSFDTIRRYFEYRGFEVEYVSNFTDVDDKIIKRSKETGMTPEEVSKKYIEAFFEDTGALNVKRATVHPTVMNTMTEIIDFIADLIEKGVAYESEGDVYFMTESFDGYGKLSDQSIQDLRVGASERTVTADDNKKRSPLDFALWKSAKPGEINWDSPWGKGRPGWHIECSVMANKYLGDTIDIHGGGQDLSFPHHENEIAQSESKTGHPFANYWMHNAFVTIGEDGEKMSKSLGNFVLVHDLIQKVDPQIVRFFLATAHYRRPLKFSEASLDDAQANLEKINTTFVNANYRLETAADSLADDEEVLAKFAQLEQDFIKEMDDDINAQNGMTILYQWIKEWNVYLEREIVSRVVLEKVYQKATELFGIFGIEEKKAALLDEDIQALIDERLEARKNKDFKRSDEIRDLLKEQGILLEDTPQGTRWRRA
ncbi:cysteinyl-tRNA synthetase [Granulicatella balaenopterae]|uniref:Cysteine--tRNA ligase n=1 Tax=Granulicatella balaenopterae TaxID=137733 RepID=A0A1H9PFP9_9LACT|nr:cysteine--tRNA ligase [Granulicatella balaenopterae]SER46685.1 cysteinyl-tRNA synthetase [Granulicatella balaenopterae]